MKFNLLDEINVKDLHDFYFNYRDKFEPVMNKGDGVIVNVENGMIPTTLYSCCPGCGKSSMSGKHKIDKNNGFIIVTPSIIYQCCQWHGYLKNGLFVSC